MQKSSRKAIQPKTIKTPFFSQKFVPIFLVVLTAFICYTNSLFNDYAFDDSIVITENKFTQKGLEGIPKLFTHDFFYGYSGEENQLGGGRWRPLSLITFAAEWEFFGKNPWVSHLLNVMLYTFCGIALLLLLRNFILPGKDLLSLFITLLFITHPIHTEVVANIKSRDEILSFLFLTGSLYGGLKFFRGEKQYFAFSLSLFMYFLALLSKENGLTYLAILPMSFYFFSSVSIQRILLYSLPYLAVAGIYVFLRVYFVGFKPETASDINISPLANADGEEWICTIVYSLGKYLQLLLFPHPLSSDYSYREIPYRHFTDPEVWIVFLFYVMMITFALWKLKSKSLYSWGILFYLLSIFIVSNLLVDVGAIVGERFLFQPSAGYAFVLGLILNSLYRKLPEKSFRNYVAVLFLAAVFIAYTGKTFSRNYDWKNNNTLFLQDVKTSTNSLRTNNSAGSAMIILAESEKDSLKKSDMYRQAIVYLEKALTISPTALDPVFNLGVAHFNTRNYPAAEKYWKIVASRPHAYNMPEHFRLLSEGYSNEAIRKVNVEKDITGSISLFRKSVELNPRNIGSWYNLGGAYFTTSKYDSARYAWEQVLKLNPQHEDAKKGLNALPK